MTQRPLAGACHGLAPQRWFPWSEQDIRQLYGDVFAVWRPWTTSLRGHGLDCGHHMAKEAPHALGEALLSFTIEGC